MRRAASRASGARVTEQRPFGWPDCDVRWPVRWSRREQDVRQHWHVTDSPVTQIPAAASADAEAHFSALRAYETDCWDVHAAMAAGNQDFVLLDVRSPESFAAGHVPGAVNLPHGRIVERNLADWSAESFFVVYCAGPHCNGADKAALRLARLGRPVKKMIGGVTGWLDEGFDLHRPGASDHAGR
jgi:rhodanese-related sulfurtransferase